MLRPYGFVLVLVLILFVQNSSGQVVTESMGIVQGVITDTLGIPISDVMAESFRNDSLLSTDISDFQGRYTLTIPLGDQDSSIVDLVVSKPGYLPEEAHGVVVAFLSITVVNFIMEISAGPIRGLVIDNEFLESQPNVIVLIAGNPAICDTTDSDGRYSLVVNYPGYYDVQFSCEDYKTEIVYGVQVDYGEIVVLDMAIDRVNWHVDGFFGNDLPWGRGSESYPFKTIQWAINITNTGDTVLVNPGTYSGSRNRDIMFNINSSTRSWIVVKSVEGCFSTIIDCQASEGNPHRGFLLTSGMDNRSVLSGFTITNGYNVGGGILVNQQSSPVIEHCRIINCESYQLGGGISVEGRSRPLIRYCELRDNFSGDGGGLGIQEATPAVENCTIINNEAYRGGGIAVLYAEPETVSILNCILRSNEDSTAFGQIEIRNSNTDINYCNIEDTVWAGTGNFDCDPWFCHSDSLDFHLSTNSCCIQAGQGGTFVGAYGAGNCGNVGLLHGTLTLCGLGDSLSGASVLLTTDDGAERLTATGSSGHFSMLVPGTPTMTDISFSYPEPTIIDLELSDYYVLPGDSAAALDTCLEQSGCNLYVVGDVNGDSAYNGLDISYGTRYFGGDPNAIPHDSCACPPGSGSWYMVGDVNASCSYNGLDITYGVGYFKNINSQVNPCPNCPGSLVTASRNWIQRIE